MWDQIGRVCSEDFQSSSKNLKPNSSNSRKKRHNYTNTLKQLVQMLPVPLQTSYKRLTKKEIILRVLHYIEHLQTSIDTARSLLRAHGGEQKETGRSEQMLTSALKRARREATPRGKKALGICKKPRKRRRTRKSERQAVSRKVCKCLPLETDRSQEEVYSEDSLSAIGDASSGLRPSKKQARGFPFFKGPLTESYLSPSVSFLDTTKGWNLNSSQEEDKEDNLFSVCAAQVAYDQLHQYPEGPEQALMAQELVYYYSSCEEGEEKESTASPWLSVQSPMDSCQEGIQSYSPRLGVQSNTCSDLGLSPSLFSSPTRLLPKHVFQGGQDELSPVLFEDVCLSPQSASFPQNLSGSLLRKSAFTLDHCYLSYSEMDQGNTSPTSRVNEIMSSWKKQIIQEEAITIEPEGPGSSSDETSDITWMPPSKRGRSSPAVCQKKTKKMGRRQRRQAAACGKRSTSSPLQLKKKCVNGFIMFCRLNRKHYIRACPGMASTAATRELAQLWRMMTKQERRPYCMKARRFSRLNNRIVRDDFSSGEEDLEPPKPFHLLLAEKSLPGIQNFGDLSLLELLP